MKPSKDKIFIIPNFIDQSEIDKALHILETKDKERWRDNTNVLIVPNSTLAAFALITNQAYLVTEKIKELFPVDKELYCVDTQIGTWTYDGGSGPHLDTQNAGFVKFSSIIYLTSDYEGGEIEFLDLGVKYKPVAGDLILFPSHGYVHEVQQVTAGNRSTIVGFYSDMHPRNWDHRFQPIEEETY